MSSANRIVVTEANTNDQEKVKVTLTSCTDKKCPRTKKKEPHTSVLLPNSNIDGEIEVHIQTHIAFENRRTKLYIQLNLLISLVIIILSFVAIAHLKTELNNVQKKLSVLQQELLSLSIKYEYFDTTLASMNITVNTNYEYLKVDGGDKNTIGQKNKTNYVQESLLVDEKKIKDPLYEYTDEYVEEDVLTGGNSNFDYRRVASRRYQSPKIGVLSAHFKGGRPDLNVLNGGSKIGPWTHDISAGGKFNFSKYKFEDKNSTLYILEGGLYMIYAQVYYETSSLTNSFSINLMRKEHPLSTIIAKCSTIGVRTADLSADASCYTSVVYNLRSHDRLYIQQTEKNRTVILRKGHSFIGLVKLSQELPTSAVT